jgi:hypothetical protein
MRQTSQNYCYFVIWQWQTWLQLDHRPAAAVVETGRLAHTHMLDLCTSSIMSPEACERILAPSYATNFVADIFNDKGAVVPNAARWLWTRNTPISCKALLKHDQGLTAVALDVYLQA